MPSLLNGWHNFIFGLLANMNEATVWDIATLPQHADNGQFVGQSHLLCPVLWRSWGGWVLVMRRCEPVSHDFDLTPWEEACLDGDDKLENYGLLDGHIVKLDYGYTSHC